jgi:hypothetical protein
MIRKINKFGPADSGRGWFIEMSCGHKRHLNVRPTLFEAECAECDVDEEQKLRAQQRAWRDSDGYNGR